MAFSLTPKQVEANRLLGSPASNIMLRGGSRSGKTFLLIRAIVQRGLNAPGSRHAIWRYRFNHAKASIWNDTLPKVLATCFPTLVVAKSEVELIATLPNKSEIVLGGLDDKARVEKVLGQEYCVSPDSLILTADLEWKLAGEIKVGEELIGFPEDLEGHVKLKPSIVERHEVIQAKRYRVVTTRGETIVSENHRFVGIFDDRRTRNFRSLSWRKVTDLKAGDLIRYTADPWKRGESLEDGWFAGMLDGEGWASRAARQVGVAQCAGVCLDALRLWFERHGIAYTQHVNGGKQGAKGPCYQLKAAGLWPSLRLLGIAQPKRLDGRAIWEDCRAFTAGGYDAEILSIEPLGVGPVVSMSTSTKTFIADGFLAHNCTLYFNESSQIPWSSVETAMSRLAQNVELAPAIGSATGRTHLPLKAYFDCNPPSKLHWSYELFRSGLKPGTKEKLANPADYVEMLMNPADNSANLPAKYFEILANMSEAKRLRFERGEWASEVAGALWAIEDRIGADGRVIQGIDSARISADQVPELQRIVVAVDPSGTKGDGGGDDIGIVVAGKGVDGRGYVLADRTCQLSPNGWGRRAVEAYHDFKADRVIGEKNFGGAMVQFVIETADKSVPFKEVTASRGKSVRAEPVAALYEQGRVSHVGSFPDMEDQMSNMTVAGYVGEGSPDRADALVWALTELMIDETPDFVWHVGS